MPPKIKQISGKLDQEINLFEPGQKFVGIDIGSSLIKTVVLKEAPIGTRLLSIGLAEIPSPPPDSEESDEDKQQRISQALKNALRQLKTNTRRVNTIINIPSQNIKNFSLPAMPEEELRESVKWEMGQNIDFSVDIATVDFVVSGETIRAGTKNLELEVVAAKTEDLKQHMEIYTQNRLKVQRIDIPAFCLWNVFQKSNQWKEEDTIALLDIGDKKTFINIFSNNVLRFTREIFFGGRTITETLAKEIDTSFADAEDIKIKYGLSEKSIHSGKIAENLKHLAAQIDRSFGYYKAQFHIERIDRLVIYGGSSKLINLDKFLTEELGIFAEIGNPFNGLLFDQKAFANLDEFDAFFSLAIGAAISSGDKKKINLLPAEFRKDESVKIKKVLFKIIPVLIACVLLTVYLFLLNKEKTLAAEKKEKESIMQSWKTQQKLAAKLKFLQSVPARQKEWLTILKGISAAIPEGVRMDSIAIDESQKRMVLNGGGENNILVIDLVRKLEALPDFTSVKLESVEEKTDEAVPFIHFKISIGKK